MATFCILSPIGWYALKMSNPAAFDLSRRLFEWAGHYHANMGLTKNKDFYNVFHGNDLIQMIRVNFINILYRYGELLFQSRAFKVFGMFLIGLVIGRTKSYEKLHQNRKLLWKVLLAGLVIGIPANYLMATFAQTPGYTQLTTHGFKQTVAYAIGVAPLALAYASIVALLFQQRRMQNLLKLIAPIGKMGLTNYIMQTGIGILTFSTLGFGFQSIGPTAWTIFAIAVFGLQIVLSTIWLHYFQYGPLEWIWRQLTYGKRLPLTKKRI
jgi:uncharacterized protein